MLSHRSVPRLLRALTFLIFQWHQRLIYIRRKSWRLQLKLTPADITINRPLTTSTILLRVVLQLEKSLQLTCTPVVIRRLWAALFYSILVARRLLWKLVSISSWSLCKIPTCTWAVLITAHSRVTSMVLQVCIFYRQTAGYSHQQIRGWMLLLTILLMSWIPTCSR